MDLCFACTCNWQPTGDAIEAYGDVSKMHDLLNFICNHLQDDEQIECAVVIQEEREDLGSLRIEIELPKQLRRVQM